MVWTDDGRFITADSLCNELYVYDYDAVGRTITNRRLFAAAIGHGLPDGSTRDQMGNVYNARVGGGKAIACIPHHGGKVQLLELPCSSPTSCTFGGRALDTLYVSSARFGMTAKQLAANPTEGGLFALDMQTVGTPTSKFG